MTVNSRRRLTEAQQNLITHVAQWADSIRMPGWMDKDVAACNLLDAYDAYNEAARDFDSPAPHNGRETSVGSRPAVGSHRRRVLDRVVAVYHMHRTGCTTDALEGMLNLSHQSCSSAVNFLEAAGWIADSGETRNTRSGRPAIIWLPTPKALEGFLEPDPQ